MDARKIEVVRSLGVLGLVLLACGKSPANEPPAAATASVRVESVPDAGPVAVPVASASPPRAPKRNLPKRVDLADVDRYSFGIAADRDHVYWVDYHGGGGVYRAKKDGSGRDQLAAEQPFTRDVTVDDNWVYWALNTGPSGGPPGAIMRVPKSGGRVAIFADQQWNPDRVFVHRGDIMWNIEPPASIMRAPSNGVPKQALAVGPSLLTVHNDDLFFVDHQAHLMKSSLQGTSTPVDLGKLDHVPNDIMADEAFVYIADAGYPVMPPTPKCPPNVPCPIPSAVPRYPNGEVFRVAIATGKTKRLVGSLDTADHVAVDDRWVYFTSKGAGLQRVPKDGGAVETIEKRAGFASRMLVDEDRLILQYGQKIVSFAR